MDDFIRLSDDGLAFVVVRLSTTYVVPFERLMEVLAYGGIVTFVGAFYPEGWGWRLTFDGLDPELVADVRSFTKEHFVRPWVGREVEFDELTRNPDEFDGMLLHVPGPFRVADDGTWFGDVPLELPASGAATEYGASFRKISAFWDARAPCLRVVDIRPPLTEPHARCTAGPTRSLVLDGSVVPVDSEPEGPRLLAAHGRGKYAGLTFEHPLCQWFEEYRSIPIHTWVSWLMGDDEMRSYASWEFAGVEDLDRATGWGFMQLPSPVVHPGVLRSSARALESLLDWTRGEREIAVYGADIVLDGRETSYTRGQVVLVEDAEALREQDAVEFGLGGAAIADLLAGPLPEPTRDPSQARFVRGAFKTPHTDPRNMVVSTFPVPPLALRSSTVNERLEHLWSVVERGRALARLPNVPAMIQQNEVSRLQDAADVAFGAITARLWYDD